MKAGRYGGEPLRIGVISGVRVQLVRTGRANTARAVEGERATWSVTRCDNDKVLQGPFKFERDALTYWRNAMTGQLLLAVA